MKSSIPILALLSALTAAAPAPFAGTGPVVTRSATDISNRGLRLRGALLAARGGAGAEVAAAAKEQAQDPANAAVDEVLGKSKSKTAVGDQVAVEDPEAKEKKSKNAAAALDVPGKNATIVADAQSKGKAAKACAKGKSKAKKAKGDVAQAEPQKAEAGAMPPTAMGNQMGAGPKVEEKAAADAQLAHEQAMQEQAGMEAPAAVDMNAEQAKAVVDQKAAEEAAKVNDKAAQDAMLQEQQKQIDQQAQLEQQAAQDEAAKQLEQAMQDAAQMEQDAAAGNATEIIDNAAAANVTSNVAANATAPNTSRGKGTGKGKSKGKGAGEAKQGAGVSEAKQGAGAGDLLGAGAGGAGGLDLAALGIGRKKRTATPFSA